MTLQRIDPEQAKQLLDSDSGYVYLDVRSDEEFAVGHVPGALNIPLLRRNPDGPGLMPNPSFLEDVQAELGTNTPIITGCLRGPRSVKAAEILIASGYTNVQDMRGGWDGELDATGLLVVAGWSRRGFPVEME